MQERLEERNDECVRQQLVDGTLRADDTRGARVAEEFDQILELIHRIAGRITGIQHDERLLIAELEIPGVEVVEVDFRPDHQRSLLEIETRAVAQARTGVEMEALVAASAAALTIYDMAKAIDRAMVIDAIRLIRKTGGRSGKFVRGEESSWSQRQ